MLLLPLILMSRRFIEIFIAANSPGWSVSSLLVSYVVLLAIAAIMGLLATGVQMLKRNSSIAAYASPGTPISARFHQDSLELVLTTGTTTVPYDKIKDLFAVGGGMFVREHGTRGIALPRELFPQRAVELIHRSSRKLSAGSTDAVPTTGRRNLVVIGAVVVIVVAVAVVVGLVRSGSNSGTQTDAASAASSVPTKSLALLPFPCALTEAQKQEFGLSGQSVQEDGPKQRRCEWDMKADSGADSSSFRSVTALMRTERRPAFEKLPAPRVIGVGNGVVGEEYQMVNDDRMSALCIVVCPTSFGFVHLEMRAFNVKGANGSDMCK
ncbi:hypothetical protein ACFWWS_40250, partial [Streptomyces sp. NPDC059083]|uniref:hypothetical protein n=1 Tax=Streptomyces sp. NPDC059083 TaxID=3346721 RepID=UPI003682D64D